MKKSELQHRRERSEIRLDRDDAILNFPTSATLQISCTQELLRKESISCVSLPIPLMASPLRGTVRRLAMSARRAATAEATNAYGRHGEKVNAYGIGVSKAECVVDGLTGGRLLSRTRVYSHQ